MKHWKQKQRKLKQMTAELKEKEREVSNLQLTNEKLSLNQIEMDDLHKDRKHKLEEQSKNTYVQLAERESMLDERLRRLSETNETCKGMEHVGTDNK